MTPLAESINAELCSMMFLREIRTEAFFISTNEKNGFRIPSSFQVEPDRNVHVRCLRYACRHRWLKCPTPDRPESCLV
jgi:hypothetical protein